MADISKKQLDICSVQGNPPRLLQGEASEVVRTFLRDQKQGMGIGLSLCQTIIEAHEVAYRGE
jgi:K+-sensing histidine kinase KdpD